MKNLISSKFSIYKKTLISVWLTLGMFCILIPVIAGETGKKPDKVKQTKFIFFKGINISAWLSQTSVINGAARLNYFTQKDIKQLAGLGFDHIRLPVAESQLFSDGKRNEETFQLIHNTIEWCRAANMRIILDCHMTKDHDFSKYQSIVLWKDTAAQSRFVKFWQTLSAEFKKYPNSLLAYELLNEPNAKDYKSWNNVSAKLIKALRQLEPERIILLGSNKANSVATFPYLTFPDNDPNIILSFHFYYPYLITHNQASFYKKLKDIKVPLQYPGQLVSDSVVATLDEESRKTLQNYNGVYNKQALFERMLPALKKAKEAGLRIHCGEFGSNFAYADRTLQLRWMQDMIAIFKENNIPYTVWGYRKQFGVFDDNKIIKDQQYLDALLR